MKQKLKDLVTLIRNSRKAQTITILVVLAGLYLTFAPQERRTRMINRSELDAPQNGAGSSPRERENDILSRFQTDVEEIKKKQEEVNSDLVEQKKQLEDYQVRTAEIFRKMLERMSEESDLNGKNKPSTANPVNLYDQNTDTPESEQQLESFGLETSPVAPPPPPPSNRVAFIGAGDTVRVKLLAGVNAPTDGTPYPAMFKLVSDVYGPDGSVLPLGEARLIAAAQGSLTDSRALFRLTTLNIRFPNGERKVVNVDGWIVGEDGIRGVPGVLIDPIGKALGGVAFTGAISGLGSALSSANTTNYTNSNGGITSAVSGNTAEYAAGLALSNAANEYGRIIRDRIGTLIPVVQILSGRECTAIFANNLSVDGLFEAMNEVDGSAEDGRLD